MSFSPSLYAAAVAAKDAAQSLRAIRDALVAEGFSESEAFTLTRDMVRASMGAK